MRVLKTLLTQIKFTINNKLQHLIYKIQKINSLFQKQRFNGRARGSAWLARSTDNRKVRSSNLRGPTYRKVQISHLSGKTLSKSCLPKNGD